jgi:hypothetical protein
MLKRLDKAIEEQNETDLRYCMSNLFNQAYEIDKQVFPRIERILIETWHHEHEDVVEMIWLHGLKDNRFIEPIIKIAKQREIYRPFDDELESTLRKCVHALKTIGTEESNLAINKLIETGNENVKIVLHDYK